MKASTQKLLTQIEQQHDFAFGQTYSNGGTEWHRTDTCLVCGLRMHSYCDPQNDIDLVTRFSDAETHSDLTLRQAAARGCN